MYVLPNYVLKLAVFDFDCMERCAGQAVKIN